jgi:hypothetical protein
LDRPSALRWGLGRQTRAGRAGKRTAVRPGLEPLEARELLSGSPVANNDTYYLLANSGTMTVSAPGVLANDTNALTARLTGRASHGNLQMNSNDGSFSYTPYPGFTGTDSFTYEAFNGANLSQQAMVTLSVRSNLSNLVVNDSYAVVNTQILTGNVMANDSPDLSSYNLQLISNPTHGTLQSFSPSSFTYAPNGSFVGTDSFQYGIFLPGSSTATASATVT